MATTSTGSGTDKVFAALLKYWRGARGMSQLDLAVSAEVSARHISFIETGRSQPSVEMVLLLAETLDVPLRDRNDLLRGAGFEARYAEPTLEQAMAGELGAALDTMLTHHEPFPLIVIDRLYRIVLANHAATTMLAIAGFSLEPDLNLLKTVFDPAARGFMPNWHDAAGDVLRRLQREAMHRPQDEELQDLLADLLAMPDIPESWRQPDPTVASDPMLTLEFAVGDIQLSFLTTVTAFNAPNNVTLDELRIESWFPLNDATAQACQLLLGSPAGSPDPV